MRDGDIYRIGSRHFLVAPIGANTLESLIVAAGATEDLEEEIAESDEDCDAEDDDPRGGNIEDSSYSGDVGLG